MAVFFYSVFIVKAVITKSTDNQSAWVVSHYKRHDNDNVNTTHSVFVRHFILFTLYHIKYDSFYSHNKTNKTH